MRLKHVDLHQVPWTESIFKMELQWAEYKDLACPEPLPSCSFLSSHHSMRLSLATGARDLVTLLGPQWRQPPRSCSHLPLVPAVTVPSVSFPLFFYIHLYMPSLLILQLLPTLPPHCTKYHRLPSCSIDDKSWLNVALNALVYSWKLQALGKENHYPLARLRARGCWT